MFSFIFSLSLLSCGASIASPPAIPALPSAQPLPNGQLDPGPRFDALMAATPIPEVQQCWREMQGRDIELTFEFDDEDVGHFGVFTGQQLGRLPADAEFHMMFLNADIVARETDPKMLRVVMLTVDHECFHRKQWIEGDTRTRSVLYAKTSPYDDLQCAAYWRVEREAYVRQCRIGKTWGMGDMFDGMCDKVDTGEYDAHYYRIAMQVYVPDNPECAGYWRSTFGGGS